MLRDFLAPGLSVIFCGTAAGAKSAAIGHYYAGRGNRFWKTVHEIGLTDRTLRPEEDGDCLKFGFGFTDLAKGVAGMDKDIPDRFFDARAVHAVISEYQPRALAFNGKRAAQISLNQKQLEYGLWKRMGKTSIWILPSTSGAANSYWSIDPWADMARGLKPE